jgi:hypothetical protein
MLSEASQFDGSHRYKTKTNKQTNKQPCFIDRCMNCGSRAESEVVKSSEALGDEVE